MKKKIDHRSISNEEFESAWKDTNNQKIIRRILYKYARWLSVDDLETCGLMALWNALACHQPSFQQKFTSSLYRFVQWEVRRRLDREKKVRRRHEEGDVSIMVDNRHLISTRKHEQLEYIKERLVMLPDQAQTIVRRFYFEGKGVEEIASDLSQSKEAVRQQLLKAVARLKELCQRIDGE